MTTIGSYIFDTVATFLVGHHYKDISRIRLYGRSGSDGSTIGKMLVIGGAGYFLLNVINGAYFNDPITDKKNRKRLGISIGAAGAGLLLNKLTKGRNYSRKKDQILYIKIK